MELNVLLVYSVAAIALAAVLGLIKRETIKMKYFDELLIADQEKVLDKLQDLPLFKPFRENARQVLLNSTNYVFDDKLNMFSVYPNSEEETSQ